MLVPTLPKVGATRRQLWLVGALVAIVAVYTVGAVILPGTFFDPIMDAFVDRAALLLVVLVAAPVGLWIAQRPQRGVILLVATVPYWGLDAILPIPSGWKESIALYTLLWTLLSIVFKPRPRYPLPKIVQPFLGYFGVALLSAAIVRGAQAEIGLKVGFFVLMAVMVWLRPLNARERDSVITIMIANAFITALIGLAQQAVGAGKLVSLGYQYNTTIRFTGHYLRSFSTFRLPFDFAFYLALVIVIGTSMSLREPRRPRSIFFFAALPVITAGLLFSFVRGAFLVVGIGILYLAVTRFRWLFFGVPLALLVLFLIPGQYATPALGSTSLGQRSQSWTDNISTIFDPVGHGIGATGSAGAKVEKVLNIVNGDAYQPDNQYFKTIYELGVLGLYFFIFLLVSAFLTARAAVPRLHGRDQALAEGLSAHILGVIVACFVATYFEIFPMDFFFWLLLSIVVTCDRTSS
jgi:hypothetical protein